MEFELKLVLIGGAIGVAGAIIGAVVGALLVSG